MRNFKIILLLSFVFACNRSWASDYYQGLLSAHGSTILLPSVYESTPLKIVNASSKDYFIPLRSGVEWTAFKTNLPAGVTIVAESSLYISCLEVLTAYPQAVDGPYFLNAYLNGTMASTWCDMTSDGGGWTLALKVSGDDRTASFTSNSLSNNWTTPLSEGNASNLIPQTTFHDGVYQNLGVKDIMIRSLSDSTKKLVWTHGANSPSLKFMVDARLRMKGKILSGAVSSLDYKSGCYVGLEPASRYVGIFPSDRAPDADGSAGTISLFNGTFVNNHSWVGPVIGWGSEEEAYTSAHNTGGGFGVTTIMGYSWNMTRHYHGLGNGCDPAGWSGSAMQGSQVFNGHGVFIREGAYKRSCKEILDATPGLPDGVYTIKPAGTAFQAYCDMTRDGGGWTMIVRALMDSYEHRDVNAVGTLSSPLSTTAFKYSDATINTIPFSMYRMQSDDFSALGYFNTDDIFRSTVRMTSKAKPTYAGSTWYGPFNNPEHAGLNSYGSSNYDGLASGSFAIYTDATVSNCRKGLEISNVSVWCGSGSSGSVWVK